MDRQEMERLVRETDVKAEKIRILFDAGVSRSDIAEFLGIRYQHVHNVLKRSNRLGSSVKSSPEAGGEVFQLAVEKGGQITLPAEYVAAQGIRDGDTLIGREQGGNLVIMSRAAAVAALREIAMQRMPGESGLLEALLAAPNIRS